MEAADIYKELALIRPDSTYYLFYGMCLRDAGEVDQAILIIREFTEKNPANIDGWVSLSITLGKVRLYSESADAMKRALALREDPPILNSLVMTLYRAEKKQEAQGFGLRSLILKDSLSAAAFAATPFARTRLKDVQRGFDPDNRDRNIISFSLWGDRPEYITGAIVNAQIAQHLYVGWRARFYCDPNVPSDARDALKHFGAQVVLMDKPHHAKTRTMWRFFVSDDSSVNVFACRDADSRLNAKEFLAVQDWLQSGKKFHLMRDHIFHMELMLAGMWGGVTGALPDIESCLKNSPEYYDDKFGDQAFLMDMVWPLIKNDVKVHDSFYGYTGTSSFPEHYDLPGEIHVGGGVKTMPHWHEYLGFPKLFSSDPKTE